MGWSGQRVPRTEFSGVREVHRGGVHAAEQAGAFDDGRQGGQICFSRKIYARALQMRFDLRKVLLLDRVAGPVRTLIKPRSTWRKSITSA